MARRFGSVTPLEQRVWDLATRYLAPEGVTVVDVEHRSHGAQQILRVAITRPGGADLDLCADVSGGLSRLLDQPEGADLLAGRYVLEVSSPGLERDIRLPAQFATAVGSQVRVKTEGPVARVVAGVLRGVDEHGIDVVPPGEASEQVDFDDIASARTVFEWGQPGWPAPKGQARRPKAQRSSR